MTVKKHPRHEAARVACAARLHCGNIVLLSSLVHVQYAIQTGTHPAITTERNINRFREQLQSLGEPASSCNFFQ